MKLYDIAESYKIIEQLANDAETDDEMVRFRDALIELEGALEEKVENIVYLIRNEQADVDALKEEQERLNNRRKNKENKINSMKEYLHSVFLKTGTERIKYPQFTVSIRNNAESVNVTDETKIPDRYFKPQEPKLSKTDLKKDLQNGIEIEGAELIRTKSLQIR